MVNEDNNEITLHPDQNDESNNKLLKLTEHVLDDVIDKVEHGLSQLKSANKAIKQINLWNKENSDSNI